MIRLQKLRNRLRARAATAMVIAGAAGFGVAALVGVALARSSTVHVAANATVMSASGSATESIVVNRHGRAVYTLSGDSKHHPKCTKSNGCFQFWPPVKVSSKKKLHKGAGIKGKLGVWRRDGFLQVTLGGHPIYTYSGDSQKDVATGEGIKTFGGTWHVIKAKGSSGSASTTTTTTTTTTTPTTTTMPCVYPPCKY